MLVEGVAMDDALPRLFQRRVADEEVGDEIEQQLLPDGQRQAVLCQHAPNEQQGRNKNQYKLATQAAMLVVVVMVMLAAVVVAAAVVVVVMMMVVCHKPLLL